MKKIIVKCFKNLIQKEELKTRVEKRVILAKFHRFFVPEDRNKYMYQDLPVDDIRLAEETSNKDRK